MRAPLSARGSAGLDSDLLGLLSRNIRGHADVQLVGGSDAFESATRFSRTVRQFESLGDPETVFTKGFRSYLTGAAFRSFAAA